LTSRDKSYPREHNFSDGTFPGVKGAAYYEWSVNSPACQPSGTGSTLVIAPVSARGFAIIGGIGAGRSYRMKMDNRNGGLLRLTRNERDAGVAVLGRAFAEYELLRYYFPDEAQRHAAAESFGSIAVCVCLKYGEVYATSEKLEGVAAWLPPAERSLGGWQIIRSVPLPVLIRFGRQGARRMLPFGRLVDSIHRRLVPYPHWYLQMIGVDPPYQGQGFSSRLLRPMLGRIDREHKPCFLETNTVKNVAIYRRFGFEVISEDRLPGAEVTSFAMLRKPTTA